jgi:hypothetical protein
MHFRRAENTGAGAGQAIHAAAGGKYCRLVSVQNTVYIKI